MNKLSKNETGKISIKYLSEIVRARYSEMFYFISAELKKIWKDWMLPEWAVLTWGWVKMKWILELSKEVLRLPAAIGLPEDSDYPWIRKFWFSKLFLTKKIRFYVWNRYYEYCFHYSVKWYVIFEHMHNLRCRYGRRYYTIIFMTKYFYD